MADEATTTAPDSDAKAPEAEGQQDVEKQAFLERLSKESGKRKEAEKLAADTAKQLADLRAQLEERENAGLPELERMKKDLERAMARADAAEQAREQAEQSVMNTRRENWVTQAASSLNFANPARAARLVDDLQDIESPEQAERAVKRLAKSDPYLIKTEERTLPGQVLKDGRPSNGKAPELDPQVQALAEGLRQFASKD